MLNRERMINLIQQLAKPSVAVLGDLALDEMIYGNAERISREAPVLILQHTTTQIILGAAANAAHNVAAYGATSYALGVSGQDYHSSLLLKALQEHCINASFIVVDPMRPTTTKSRISAAARQSVTQQIVRIDREDTSDISEAIQDKLLSHLNSIMDQLDAVILSDYSIGVLADPFISRVIEICRQHHKLIAVDSQKNLHKFKNVTVITPNQPEAELAVGYAIVSREDLYRAGADLLRLTAAQYVLITRGSDGMILFSQNGLVEELPAFNKTDVFDVTGAGDTVVSTFTLALAIGASPLEAMFISNLAASIVVRHFGAVTTNSQELIEAMYKLNGHLFENIHTNHKTVNT